MKNYKRRIDVLCIEEDGTVISIDSANENSLSILRGKEFKSVHIVETLKAEDVSLWDLYNAKETKYLINT